MANCSAERAEAWIELASRIGAVVPVSIQPHYNLLVRNAFESPLRPVAVRHRLGVVPYFGLAAGFLTGKYRSRADADGVPRASMVADYLVDAGFAVIRELEVIATEREVQPGTVALAWLRAQPTIVAPIAGASVAHHIAPLLASATLELTQRELAPLPRAADAFGRARETNA